MPRRIDTQAVINAVRLDEQAGDPAQPAAGFWLVYAKAAGLYVEDDAGNVTGPLGVGGGDIMTSIVNGRLTLTTATPVTTADVTGAATLYFTPYKGNQIALYDGVSTWELLSFTEKSLSLVGYTASTPYDIWAYNNGGTVALESTAWANTTTRATALALQDGVYVKTGATTRRYLGTIHANASGGQTDDTVTKRFVWNYYNRIQRSLYVYETADTWVYTTATWRSLNNSVANRVEFVLGLSEDLVYAMMMTNINTAGATNNDAEIGICLDNTNANNAQIKIFCSGNGAMNPSTAIYNTYVAIGYHFLQATERANVSGAGASASFYGDVGGPANYQGGMTGNLFA